MMCPVDLGEEQLRDQIARKHEEDVDTDETAVERGEAGVIRDDEEHRDRAQTLDVASQTRLVRDRDVRLALPNLRCRDRHSASPRGRSLRSSRAGAAHDGTSTVRGHHSRRCPPSFC
jgi:hypothetical protein